MNDKILFIHIPKTAGNSIYRNLLEHNLNIFKMKHFTLTEIKKKINIYNFIKLCVIRNPYDRFVSLYFFKISHDEKFYNLKIHIEKKTNKSIKDIDNKTIISYLKNLEGVEWDEKFIKNNKETVLKNINKLKNINLNNINNLKNKKFKNWLIENISSIKQENQYIENEKIDFLLKFENLDEEYNLFLKKLNINNIKLEKKNTSKHKNYLFYYDNELLKIIKPYIIKDCEMFNYKIL